MQFRLLPASPRLSKSVRSFSYLCMPEVAPIATEGHATTDKESSAKMPVPPHRRLTHSTQWQISKIKHINTDSAFLFVSVAKTMQKTTKTNSLTINIRMTKSSQLYGIMLLDSLQQSMMIYDLVKNGMKSQNI